LPKTGPVISAAVNLAGRLKQYRERLAQDPAQVQATAKQLMKVAAAEDRIDRDFAEQLYHALAARERARLVRTSQAGEPVKPNETLESLRKHLLLRRGNLTFDIRPEANADLKKLLESP
jgi:hypothetical protein